MISSKEKIIDKYTAVLSFAGSVILHLIVFIFTVLVLRSSSSDYSHPGYAIITSINLNNPEQEVKSDSPEENKIIAGKDSDEKSFPEEKVLNTGFSKIEEAGFDSTNLNYIYKEPTLNVHLKYPIGWTYLDQQRKNKLDGITFWSVGNSINPPPYVNIEVVEKYLFNPAKFKFRYKFKNFEGYYNGPEEIEGQVSQQIYIRTNDDEDFIIKLIVNGRENFNKFQPVFFAMINSFRFGNSLFF